MSLAVVMSCAQVGTTAPEVVVEVHLARGLPSFSIVGLAETAVKESRDRVRGAISNSKFEFPNKKIFVNLAPADLPKGGGRFDLPIALGVLAASAQIPTAALAGRVFLGELAFSGTVREISGGLVAALALRGSGHSLILPPRSAAQAALVDGVEVYGVGSLLELSGILCGMESFAPVEPLMIPAAAPYPDMNGVVGQQFAKIALEVAAAGAHSMLMIGSPGSGKTMLANRLPGILPNLTVEEALATAAVTSLVEKHWEPQTWRNRPFRAPHHSASGAALVGGGSIPRPGEISLAHNGVLFLDELTEFDRRALDLLREPLEAGYINISRASMQLKFPCQFIFIGATNPCQCGYLGEPTSQCRCSPQQVQRYLAKLSGPLLDRIDIQIPVQRVQYHELRAHSRKPAAANNPHDLDTSETIRQRVVQTRTRQLTRQGVLNSQLSSKQLQEYCALTSDGEKLLDAAFNRFNLSARTCHRILKLARTIADMQSAAAVTKEHVAMAIKMRCLEQKFLMAK